MSVTLYSAQVVGLDAQPISVEVDITPGLHVFTIVGLADKEVQESRERISSAIKNIGALPPYKKSQRVIVNLAPAHLKKEGPAFDLPIALGYLLATRQVVFDPAGILCLGELGLDGTLRSVPGVLPMALSARAAGFRELIVPRGNGGEAATVRGIDVYEAKTLMDAVEHLEKRVPLPRVESAPHDPATPSHGLDFKDIQGQEKAKRALQIAAAGGHNALLSGPPGAGKSILASAIISILPPLLFEEAMEVTKIYSIAGLLTQSQPFVRLRPFRNPHHTSSHTAIIGGGSYPRPGEATLAHRGVLFLDEFPEFDRRVIESLRQPLEERSITVARAHGVATFPAHFMLIAAMNPCPCGNFGNPRQDCTCSPGAVLRYRKKISGPLMDRIDLHVEVPALPYAALQKSVEERYGSDAIRQRVEQARSRAQERFAGLGIATNAEMSIREIKRFVHLPDALKSTIQLAYERHKLSARSYHRILKLSRTIADLEDSRDIEERHISEALQYRPKIET
ncbi:MAG: YifB family Mg chelatase-like AAA ATPase [Candidatus Sungbacteria bacterium]|nr:YifB family Mg chelatase-like AAA ATPase [Candidatus Sungbacteria bacterium]